MTVNDLLAAHQFVVDSSLSEIQLSVSDLMSFIRSLDDFTFRIFLREMASACSTYVDEFPDFAAKDDFVVLINSVDMEGF